MAFFKKLKPNTPFRWEHSYVSMDGSYWIYGVFTGFEERTVMYRYWDYPDGIHCKWKKIDKDHTSALEVWDPAIPDEALIVPVYLRVPRQGPYIHGEPEEYELSEWVLGDLAGSSWVNRYTYHLVSDGVFDWNRFGEIHLYHGGHMNNHVTMYRTVDGVEQMTIEHWDRYDTMPHEQKVKCAEGRVSYCVAETRSTNHCGGPSPWAKDRLEEAREMYHELTGAGVIPPEVLNRGIDEGQQLALM
jgi:hypothetical protein